MQKIKLIHEVRAVKNKKELASIIKAQRISEEVLRNTLRNLRSGTTELAVTNFIKQSFTKLDAPILAFPPIVAFGKNTANIHHEPGKTRLKKGDIIMFDFGCTVGHYCSDMTRTFFWGEPKKKIQPKQKEIYESVLHAMDLAMNKIKNGERRAKMIDKAARGFLNKKYDKKKLGLSEVEGFPHGLGHGVGTVIHEWPNFKPKSEDVLPVGCVMTIEPGIYLKGFGGIRIEDMVLITKNGYQNLTNFPKDLKSATL